MFNTYSDYRRWLENSHIDGDFSKVTRHSTARVKKRHAKNKK